MFVYCDPTAGGRSQAVHGPTLGIHNVYITTIYILYTTSG